MPAAWVTGLGAGDAGFIFVTLEQRIGEELATFQTAVWADFGARVPLEVARRRAEAVGSGEYDIKRFTLSA